MGQETKPPVNHEITTDQIECFIDEIAALPCPACGSDEWGLVNDNIAGNPSLVFSKSGNLNVTKQGQHFPLVALGCRKCFYIRLHALLPLLEHLSRKEQSVAKLKDKV